MEKTNLNCDMSLTKFLQIYFGANPSQIKNITHKDAFRLFSLEALTDVEFWAEHNAKDLMTNYIRVKDKHNIIMYYSKLELVYQTDIINSDNMEFNKYSEMENCFILLQTIDIKSLTPRELYELKQKLKKIKKYVGKGIDRQIYKIDKQLRYLKRRN